MSLRGVFREGPSLRQQSRLRPEHVYRHETASPRRNWPRRSLLRRSLLRRSLIPAFLTPHVDGVVAIAERATVANLRPMSWSWKIGRFAGIDAYVHASFLLLVLWTAHSAYQRSGAGLAALLGVVLLLAVFASVLLHELGHALVARRFGIRTRRIVLLPIGGVAQLEGEPSSPRAELLIAAAGPMVNFALAIVGGSLLWITGLPLGGLLGSWVIANVSLGLFNLLPAFPMDGGRILRAALATRMGAYKATNLAVYLGKTAAVVFGIIGLFTNWLLALVAAFVWMAADAEGRRAPFAYMRKPSRPRGRVNSFWSGNQPSGSRGPFG